MTRLLAGNPALQGHLAMLTFSALVAGSFLLGAQVAGEIAPAAINALRFALAAIIIGIAAMATGGIPRGAARAPWRYLVLGGFFALYFLLMFEGLKTASALNTSAVFTLTPVLSAGFGLVLLGQVTTRRMALALAIGALGAVWVIFRGDWQAARAMDIGRGEVIFFFGCVSHAVYTPLVRRLNRGERPLVFSFGMMIAGCLILGLFGWQDLATTDWAGLRPLVWITIGYLVVFASASTFVLLQFATMRLPSAKVMAYTYLTPSWVILLELATGQGAPPALTLVGIALTVAALALLLEKDPAAPAR
ncbi:DMT family transporter [Marinibacterium sp. SX1]|uniref:DMT family transporter n=1 Tax=Marinibacterium sp. SX1 TaxID=3388424 RepID=UPI003D1821ED